MTYAKAQFIAYRIYTGAAQGPGELGQHYVGLDDPAADVRQRLKLMVEAVHAAGDCRYIDPDPSVLKVFMAPEFYFRARTGGYKDKSYLGARGADPVPGSIVGGLGAAVKDARWKDWLFVFGTAMVADLMPGEPEVAGETSMLDVALVQKGQASIIVRKKRLSPVDWEDFPGVSPAWKDVRGFPLDPPHYYDSAWPFTCAQEINAPQSYGNKSGTIFTLDGIAFGLEICADHGSQRLRRATPKTGDVFVQLQLVPASGTSIAPAGVATSKGGLVFNVDGGSQGATAAPLQPRDGYNSQLYAVTGKCPPSMLGDMQDVPALATVRANTDLSEVQRVFWLPPDNDPKNMAIWSPNLAIYGPVTIPPAVTA